MVSAISRISSLWSPGRAAHRCVRGHERPFTIAYGAFDVLVGNLTVSSGSNVATSDVDFTEYVARGDVLEIGGAEYAIDLSATYDETTVPFAAPFAESSGVYQAYRRYTSIDIAYDADASAVEAALENTPSIGAVAVTNAGASQWTVTFISDRGDVDSLVPNDNLMEGGIVGVTQTAQGMLPKNYMSKTVYASDAPLNYTIHSLVTGTEWYANVIAINDRGMGEPQVSSPTSSRPVQAPGIVGDVTVSVVDNATLRIEYDETVDEGGRLCPSIWWSGTPRLRLHQPTTDLLLEI